MTRNDVLRMIQEKDVRFVDLWFVDVLGAVKRVTISARQIEAAVDLGVSIDGSALDGTQRVAESDMRIQPDLNTLALLPWQTGGGVTARMICNVHTPQGDPFIGDSRSVLIRALDRAQAQGLHFKTGMELEFFLFPLRSDGLPDVAAVQGDIDGYFDMAGEQVQGVLRDMLVTLEAMGVPVAGSHSEIGACQHEIDLQHGDALRSADHVLTARVAMKAVAQRHKMHCTFMPRPAIALPGSGMHTHQSLHAADSGANLFHDPDDEYALSRTARDFMAGQLHHARGMCAVLAPLVNSYKRLGTSFEAPVYVTWAHVNSAALIRVPHVRSAEARQTRLELRCPDPSANPYLASAVMLMAGLDGITEGMRVSLPAPYEETLLADNRARRRQAVLILPASLEEALVLLEADSIVMTALGPYISDRYLAAKRQEVQEYKEQVTSWEMTRYIERY